MGVYKFNSRSFPIFFESQYQGRIAFAFLPGLGPPGLNDQFILLTFQELSREHVKSGKCSSDFGFDRRRLVNGSSVLFLGEIYAII